MNDVTQNAPLWQIGKLDTSLKRVQYFFVFVKTIHQKKEG